MVAAVVVVVSDILGHSIQDNILVAEIPLLAAVVVSTCLMSMEFVSWCSGMVSI